MDDRDQVAAIARLEATVNGMAVSMGELKALVKVQADTLNQVQQQLAQAQGGLRVVMWLGGIVTVVTGAVIGWAIRHLHWS
ncbi:MAG: hypothetical protein WCK28_00055 [Burkholderiales bacterium]